MYERVAESVTAALEWGGGGMYHNFFISPVVRNYHNFFILSPVVIMLALGVYSQPFCSIAQYTCCTKQLHSLQGSIHCRLHQ